MKVLLHSILHPSFWTYLMEILPEHEWYVEPADGFQRGGVPRDHVKYTVVPINSKIKFDVQIYCLSTHIDCFDYMIEAFPIPMVYLNFERTPVPNLKIEYPLISGCQHIASKDYPNIRYTYVCPSKTLWNVGWKGDIPKVFIPAQSYLQPQYSKLFFTDLINKLKQTDIPLEIIENKTRTIPFQEWRDFYIHNRVLLDCSDKSCSFCIEEAMTLGMPIVTRNALEAPLMLRDSVDAFLRWNFEELVDILHKFTEDYSFAAKWAERSRRRGKVILSVEDTRSCFNKAFVDAIELFNSTKNPFEKKVQ